MIPFDDEGRELDAKFSVEPLKHGAYVILESRGGGKGGPRPPRNEDYSLGFKLLLARLGRERAELIDIEVYSRVTRTWPLERRRISAPSFPLPLMLNSMSDTETFRLELGRESAALGRARGSKGGNPTKRLRLTLNWPKAAGRTTEELERLLASPSRASLVS